MSNKLNNIWLKRLNSCISKDERLNWSKFSKLTNFKIHYKLRDIDPCIYNRRILVEFNKKNSKNKVQ